MANIALIIAGGVGERMHQNIPKQFLNVHDKPVIIYTLEVFQKHPNIDAIEVVCLDGWQEILSAYAKQYRITKLEKIVRGGDKGQDSIRNGVYDLIERYTDNDDIVLIHDAIRPLVSTDIISDSLRVCRTYGNATTVIPCASAMLVTEDGLESNSQIPRDNLKMTQTPQTFYLHELCEMHKLALEKGITNSVASCTMYMELGRKIYLSNGSEKNIKITTIEDIEIFEALLNAKRPAWLSELGE